MKAVGIHQQSAARPRDIPGTEFPCTATRLPGNRTLIADGGTDTGTGSRVLEVDPSGEITWSFSDGLQFVHSAVETKAGTVLISDTNNNRVIEVARSGEIIFSVDALSDGSRLSYPNNAVGTADGNILITDRNNDRCLVVNRHSDVLWQYNNGLKRPHGAEELSSGNIIICDSYGNRVVEIDRKGNEVWSYSDGLDWPRHARRLLNGNTLISDSKNARVIEVSPLGDIVWQYKVDYLSKFYHAERLESGHTLISDQMGQRIIEVDEAGNVVWQFSSPHYPHILHDPLSNGDFSEWNGDGLPRDWVLMKRYSEGGGRAIRDGDTPGLEYDRNGALCLQQTVSILPGSVCRVQGAIRTEDLDGFACFQASFIDKDGIAIQDALDAPRGRAFKGTNDWISDGFDAVAPNGAAAAEIRLFITGCGRAWMSGIKMNHNEELM